MAQIGETELDVRALWRGLWRKAWLIGFLTVAAAIATYVGLGFVDPLYTADTSILIEARESPLTRPPGDSGVPSTDFDTSAIQSQVEVLKSRGIAEAVIDKLDLTHRAEFDPARRASLLRSVLVAIGIGENPTDSTIRQRVMDSYFSHLSVYPLLQSRVIGVEFSASDPKLAAEVAETVADSFVDLQQSSKRESAVAATEWLQQEIERLRGKVAEAEQAVADYRQKHGLFDVDQTGTGTAPGADATNLSTQQLGEINAELARARAARAEAEARSQLVGQLLTQGGAPDASEEVLNSQLIQRLQERQGALRAQIADLSTTLLPTHPRIRALQEQLASLDGQIHDEVGKVLESLKTAALVAKAREESLVKSLNEAKGEVSQSNDQGIELRALQREAAAQRELLESFLTRYREASARTDANYLPADARIISRAVAPTQPSFPKKTMLTVAAAIAMLLLSSAIVLLSEFMSGRAFRVIGAGMSDGDAKPLQPAEVAAGDDDVRIVPASGEPMGHAEPELEAELEPEPESGPELDRDPTGASDMALATELLDQTPPATSESERLADEEPEPLPEPVAAAPEPVAVEPEAPKTGTAGLAEILTNSSVRLALFAGAEGGEGAAKIAFAAARHAAKQKVRCVLVDVGGVASDVLGHERPGLGDLLMGEAAFGEVIQRDDTARVHVIPLGSLTKDTPMQRMRLVIGALTHTYDRVIIVADKVEDWPDEYIRPDIAAIVCGPETTESLRTELYDFVLARGAHSAIIVRYTSDFDLGDQEESAAA